MNKEERLEILLKSKIYVKTRETYSLCKTSVLNERIETSKINFSIYSEFTDNFSEIAYRYLNDDNKRKQCKQCSDLVKFIRFQKGWAEFCSVSCASKYKAANGICYVNVKGWKHTDEAKTKMSENHADFSGNKSGMKRKLDNDENFRKEISETHINRWKSYSKDQRKIICKNMSLGVCNSEKFKSTRFHKNHKSGYYDSKKMTRKMFYRSSWEKIVCEYLENNSNVTSFNIEPYVIEYSKHGETKYTRIDFEVSYKDGRKIIIEVKPIAFINTGNVPYKLKGYEAYAKENNLEFVLITENELKELEKYI